MDPRQTDAIDTPAPEPADDRLKGWKEIAQSLHTSPRTAQRWEQQLRMPIHRLGSGSSAIVFASRRELGAWQLSLEGRKALVEAADSNADALGTTHEAVDVETVLPSVRVPRSYWAAALVVLTLAGVSGAFWLAQRPQPGTISFETAARGPATPVPLSAMIRLRLRLDDGASPAVFVPINGTATMTAARRATYTFSARRNQANVELTVSWVELGRQPARQGPDSVLSVPPNKEIILEGLPGLLSLEWAPAER